MPINCYDCEFNMSQNKKNKFIKCFYWELENVPSFYGCEYEKMENGIKNVKKWYCQQVILNRVRQKHYDKTNEKNPNLFGEKGIIKKDDLKNDNEVKEVVKDMIGYKSNSKSKKLW